MLLEPPISYTSYTPVLLAISYLVRPNERTYTLDRFIALRYYRLLYTTPYTLTFLPRRILNYTSNTCEAPYTPRFLFTSPI